MKSFIVLCTTILILSSCFEKPEEVRDTPNTSDINTVVDVPGISDEVILDIIADEESEEGTIDPVIAPEQENTVQEGELPDVATEGEIDSSINAEEQELINENIDILDEILTDILDS